METAPFDMTLWSVNGIAGSHNGMLFYLRKRDLLEFELYPSCLWRWIMTQIKGIFTELLKTVLDTSQAGEG